MKLANPRESMVDNQIRPADVVDYKVLEAFLSTKREHFVPQDKVAQAYGEYEIGLGKDRAMMTPRTFAKLVETANVKPHEDVLVIGAGLGYEAAILAQLSSTVIALEEVASLAKQAEENLAQEGFDNAVAMQGALKKGYEESAPYDLILFNGAIGALPEKLGEQLKENGRIVAIVERDGVYTCKMWFQSGGRLFERSYFQASAPHLPKFAKKQEFVF